MKLRIGDIVRRAGPFLGTAQQRAQGERNLRMGIIIEQRAVTEFESQGAWSHVYWPRLETTRWSPTVTLALEEN